VVGDIIFVFLFVLIFTCDPLVEFFLNYFLVNIFFGLKHIKVSCSRAKEVFELKFI
jgi:hypothetical protein